MVSKRHMGEAEELELYRVSLTNAENQPEIAAISPVQAEIPNK